MPGSIFEEQTAARLNSADTISVSKHNAIGSPL